MKSKISFFLLLILISACNPYKGFKGVEKKGMGTRKTPSQELRDGFDKTDKRTGKNYKKLMRKNKKRLGTKESK